MNDQELHAYCEAWRHWCWTRKYYIAPGAKNILARMQPSRSPPDKDHACSADLSYFNMAIHALIDMADAEGKKDAKCFVDYYFHRVKNVKVVAAKMEISRQTFYRKVNRFARNALSMSHSLKRVTEEMAKEPELVD